MDKSTERQIFANLKAQAKENIVLLISHRLYSVSADESDHLDGRWKNSGGYA
ncbi:MAG: hypothetical protein ACLTZM_04110 [Ruminococcus sp.]